MLPSLIKKAKLTLGGVGILRFGIVILLGPYLFSMVFGKNWIIAGEYARWIGILVASYYLFSDDLIAVALFGISCAILNLWLITITLRISKRRMVRQ